MVTGVSADASGAANGIRRLLNSESIFVSAHIAVIMRILSATSRAANRVTVFLLEVVVLEFERVATSRTADGVALSEIVILELERIATGRAADWIRLREFLWNFVDVGIPDV